MNHETITKAGVAGQPERTRSMKCSVPEVDIIETPGAIELLADMPGVGSDGVNATVQNGVLTIEGNSSAAGTEKSRPGYAEFSAMDFRRTFTLSDEIDASAITAVMKDGVLRVVMPKAKEAVPRRITVQNG